MHCLSLKSQSSLLHGLYSIFTHSESSVTSHAHLLSIHIFHDKFSYSVGPAQSAGASPLKNTAIRDGHSLSSRSIATSEYVLSLTRVASSKKVNARLLYGQAPLIFGEEGVDFLTGVSFGT